MIRKEIVTILAVLVLGTDQLVKATPVNSNSIIEDGIEYYVQTDKSVYDLGEDVETEQHSQKPVQDQWTRNPHMSV